MSLLSRGSIHQGHEGFSGQSRGKQCSFMRLSALLTTQTIALVCVRQVYKDFQLFYVDICTFHFVFLCFMLFYVDTDRFKVSCFSMSTGFALVYVDRFKVLRFSMSIFALFPVYMSTGLCNYGVMFFYVVIFNPDVSMYIQS